MKRHLAFYLVLLFAGNLSAQTPGGKQNKSILLLNGTAHIGNGKVIPRSAIAFEQGKITMVLDAFDARMDSSIYDTIIHIDGKHVYPGFIAPNSRLGLVEIDAVRATRDFDDVGLLNPHVRSLIAYNTESRITSTVRTNGVLMAQVSPEGGLISGSSSILNLDGWNWEDAVLKKDDGIHLQWPRDFSHRVEDDKKKKEFAERYLDQQKELKAFLKEALAYSKKDFHLEKNIRFEAMKAVFKKESRVYIHANTASEISDAIYALDEFNLSLVIVGGSESWLVADLLNDRNIPVLLRRVHSLPDYEDDPIHLPFELPFILHQKGILLGLENSGSMEAMGTRNLPFYAGTAAAYGLDKEVALSMISLNTAKILGIDKQVGSLETGKLASLFVSEGDALDMRSNKVVLAFIEGRQIDLSNPQKELYEKYSKKYKD